MRNRRRAARRPAPATFDVFADQVEKLSELERGAGRTANPANFVSAHALAHLRRFFRRRRADSITSSLIVEYGIQRQQQGAASTTINQEELRALEKILRCALDAGAIREFPVISFVPPTSQEAVAARAAADFNSYQSFLLRQVASRTNAASIRPLRKKRKKPGPVPKITEDVWREDNAECPDPPDRRLSDAQRAKRITRKFEKLGITVTVTDDDVRRARLKYD